MLPSELLNTDTSLIEISLRKDPLRNIGIRQQKEGGSRGNWRRNLDKWTRYAPSDVPQLTQTFKSFYFYHILKPTSCINSLSGTEENTAWFRYLKKSLVLARGSCTEYKWIIFNIWNSVKPSRYLTLKQHGVQIAVWPTTAFLVVRTWECNPLKSSLEYLKICDLSVNSVIEEPHSPPWCLWLMTVS